MLNRILLAFRPGEPEVAGPKANVSRPLLCLRAKWKTVIQGSSQNSDKRSHMRALQEIPTGA